MRHTRLSLAGSLGFLLALGAPDASAQSATAAQAPTPVPSRDSITARLGELRKIHTPEGIETLEQVSIGGVPQWISIRGKNRANPVILFIHGGPGVPMMPMTWAYQAPWEDFFTVVQWDERGIGKNARSADREALRSTLTNDRLIEDAVEVAAWVKKRLEKDRIVVMGYSHGTTVARGLARLRPDWLHAYVGVGQGGDGGEAYLYQRVIELATRANNDEALRELKALAPYPGPNRTMDQALVVRKWARRFNGGWFGKPDLNLFFALPEWAPEYSQEDVDVQTPATQWFSRALGMGRGLAEGAPVADTNTFKVPVIVMMGRHDLHTPYEPSRTSFEKIQAPRKRFITFERSGHFPMLEEPGLFLFHLIQEVLPLTEGRAAYGPLP